MSDAPEDLDVEYQAAAALRRQEAEIASVLAGVAEANDLIERARAELDAEAAESQQEREDEEKEARSGALGSSRQALQTRLDRDETTWRDVLSGRDDHPTAQAYRDEIGGRIRHVIDQESAKDPEFRQGLEQMARHTEPGDPPVRMPDWPAVEPTFDGRSPRDPERGQGSSGIDPFGTW